MLRVLGIIGFICLYIPLILLMVYSFNAGDRAAVWGGFSMKWYGVLMENEDLLKAAITSLKVALLSATLATCLGVMAAYALVRFGKFRGQNSLDLMVTSPLVMPEVITGFSLLMLFINMEAIFGWPQGRSVTTIVLAHTTFCMAYVTVTVRARLVDFDTSLIEAALDLGARPLAVFFQITLPIIAPAIVAGWLLAFTLSLDDVVVAQFTSGPNSTTLPVKVYSQVRLGVSPEYNALASLMIFGIGAIVITALQIQHKVSMQKSRFFARTSQSELSS